MPGCNGTRAYGERVPNQPATPNRTVRVPDEVWFAAKQVATDRGETVTAVIIDALVRYVRTYGHAPA